MMKLCKKAHRQVAKTTSSEGNTSTKAEITQDNQAAPLPPCNGATLQHGKTKDLAKPKKSPEELLEQCKDIVCQSNVLDKFCEDIARRGLVGEERAAKLIFLVLSSRVLDRPLCVVVKGQSSGGKSFLVDRVLEFFPASAVERLTGMSDKALAYGTAPLEHRILVVTEAAGLSGGMGAYFLRSLISEGKIDYETVDSANGLKARRIHREGPTGLLSTTTKLHLDAELENRLFSIPIDDSPAQTRAILLATAEPPRSSDVDIAAWRAFQQWFADAEHRYHIPFAKHLALAMPERPVRIRRDFPAILALIGVHALLHQAARSRDEKGQVIAEFDDYEAIRELVVDIVGEAAQMSVPEIVRETVEAVRTAKAPNGLPLQVIAKKLGLDKSTVSRRVAKAKSLGYLKDIQLTKNQPAQITLGEPLPEEVEILPSPDALQCCGVAKG